MNAYARAIALTSQDYLVELDDDVVEAPHRWDETLLDAFRRIPRPATLRRTSSTIPTTRPRNT